MDSQGGGDMAEGGEGDVVGRGIKQHVAIIKLIIDKPKN